jgi:glutamine synthetase
MRGEELVGFLHCDLSGLNRGRSVPASELESRLEGGVGWVPADQVLMPFGPIAEPNPWGSTGDLRLLPDAATEARVDLWDEVSPLHFFLCDAANTDGSPWDSCPRTFLKDALARLEQETGLGLVASFEQEFVLRGPTLETGPGFSFEAQRLVEGERNRLGIRPLPDSLGASLDALEADTVVRSWFSKDLLDCYLRVKRTEISLLEGVDPQEACERYLRVY